MGTETETEATLVGRVRELERALEERERELAAQRRELTRFQAMVEHAPVGVFQDDAAGRCVFVNAAWCWITGMSAEEALGGGWLRLFHPDDISRLERRFAECAATGAPFVADYRMVRPDGEVRWVHGQSTALTGAGGELLGYVGTIVDITEQQLAQEALLGAREDLERRVEERTEALQRAAEERGLLEAQVIASQEALIRELSTPLVPIAAGVLAMPLVGRISPARAQQILEALLGGVQAHGAGVAILDITGVPELDAHAANALVAAARAARLLGAEVVISGMGPAVARTLVGLGAEVELGGIVTRGNMQAAIAYALGRGAAAGRRRR